MTNKEELTPYQKEKLEKERQENELVKKWGEEHLNWLRETLSYIQKNSLVSRTYTHFNPLNITKEECDFLEEEDKKSPRYFVDYGLDEYKKEYKSYSPRWVREPFQTDSQVKRILSYYFNKENKVKDRVRNLRITDEECLDYNIDDGYVEEQGEISLREKMFSKRYCFSMDWKHKIEISHRISINIVEEKDSDFFNKSNPTKKLFESFDLESQKKKAS